MPAHFVAALDHKDVAVRVAINGVPLSLTTPRTAKGAWRLEPFVVQGINTLELQLDDPQPGASVVASVQRNAGDGWSVVATQSLAPAEAGSVVLEFSAPEACVPAPGAATISALSGEDRDAIGVLLQRVRASVAADPGGELIDLFHHRLDYCEAIGTIGRSDLQAQLLEDFAALADPDLSPPAATPAALPLLCAGTLCVPLGADGNHWLHATAGRSGVVYPLALARLAGKWTIVG